MEIPLAEQTLRFTSTNIIIAHFFIFVNAYDKNIANISKNRVLISSLD